MMTIGNESGSHKHERCTDLAKECLTKECTARGRKRDGIVSGYFSGDSCQQVQLLKQHESDEHVEATRILKKAVSPKIKDNKSSSIVGLKPL
jgi:hypothetical protein